MTTPTSNRRYHVRWMVRADMGAINAIERNSFEYPWREQDFIDCLRQRNVIGMAAIDPKGDGGHDEGLGVPLGFMLYELHQRRLNIINFAVARCHRRLGVGRTLVQKLIGKLSSGRRNRITLEIRETNIAAQLFFKACGFRAVDVQRGIYDDTDEDAYLFEYRYANRDGGSGDAMCGMSEVRRLVDTRAVTPALRPENRIGKFYQEQGQ